MNKENEQNMKQWKIKWKMKKMKNKMIQKTWTKK